MNEKKTSALNRHKCYLSKKIQYKMNKQEQDDKWWFDRIYLVPVTAEGRSEYQKQNGPYIPSDGLLA